ncbi:hypothetical protein N2603_38100 [Bradyrhizobium huanghuaihaiense]|uniref:hypothetical protein n=1 Tax=Bradyrhizobium huanghuaihaiense TaxID=990078 RepID=UPI0021AAEB42|nr:hypothetical protein [Bradyrhizobium sp. CB3035]UWU75741.1 hypothetical protein N2603_38100 [Bradyrhizobium sp. CB3035]
MSNGQQETKPDYKQALDLARYELDYRRKKQWDIFSWSVTILVSVMGGIIVLISKENMIPDPASRRAMALALGFLTIYAGFWIWENIQAEDHADGKIRMLHKAANLPDDLLRKSTAFALGYVPIVLLIGAAAVGAVLLVNTPVAFGIAQPG